MRLAPSRRRVSAVLRVMSTNGSALRLLEPRAPATLPAPRSLHTGLIRLGADELLVLERPTDARPVASRPARGSRFTGLHAIHACYAPEPTTEGWLRGLLAALQPLTPSARWFGWGDGLVDEREPGMLLLDGSGVTASPAAAELLAAVGRECYRDLLRPRPPVQLLSHRLRSLPPALERRVADILRAAGLPDAVLLFGGELDGRAIALGMVVAPGVRPPSRTIGLLRSVAGHLNTARRLRGLPALAGAVHDPGTRDGARSIGPRVVAALRASDAIRWVDPQGAAALWRAFLDGGHALVDHWVRDGRRLILARRCQDADDRAALRPAEATALAYAVPGLQTAEIAELLGISPATVTLHLTSARARLRCGTRRELVALLSGTAFDA